jgi:hypothetical protein
MKPLVYYCRWHDAKLQLRGRDETAVWGQLVSSNQGAETAQTFRFNLQTWQLTLEEPDGEHTIQLDEMGVEIKE